ncbi:MAG: 16S rRNA (adenine(1518)-N(6)/adenine(1519)-N(6))-dimethyltransferase RsmA [Nitrospira sp.]|nr:16S rRNA (adenine(1518)-N(6)/adenine(1519)-N(6))-dimethyltransferase RsmA [Nitrospira sp.]MCP9461739.1 16S rRNA (adenine(1518)-N(6)/adenine(1519)-N(6))-dimethyltransferase RsmA [Nitrospira sp.]MCP9475678.1 16S rRNA (adenine(1518)-N(6)/adenine(1519)-N(6))-dimethyltransferase RsmA [Nitrospira sp.]
MERSAPPVPIKHLGQHFLIDPNIARKIVSLAALTSKDSVLEIGPGRGILTVELCRVANRVTAIEIDRRLYDYLIERDLGHSNLHLVPADAMVYPFQELPIGTVVVANLPYYISTPLLFRLLEHRRRFPRLVLMLQNEVADRLVAKPGTSDYGVLSVMAQYAATIEKPLKVSPRCFRPRPEVESAVVILQTRETQALSSEEELRFASLVKASFAHRRKTLVNSLKNQGYPQEAVLTALRALALPLEIRAETLSVEQFIELTRLLPTP